MNIAWLFSLLLLNQPASNTESVRAELRASTLQPYAGQVVELTLQIDLHADIANRLASADDSGLAELEIPWLRAESVDWTLPPEQWLCEQSEPNDSIRFRIPGWPLPIKPTETTPKDAKPSTPRQFQLRWRFSANTDAIRFDPVRIRLGNMKAASEALELEVLQLPGPDRPLPGFNPGVGQYQLEGAIEPSEIRLGQEITLTLTVRGTGPLDRLPRPELAKLDDLVQRFLIEPGTETWSDDGTTRILRYLLKPRTADVRFVPPIFYHYFDPEQEIYQHRATASLPLIVKLPESSSREPALPYPPGLIPERLRLVPLGVAEMETTDTWPGRRLLVSILVVPPLTCLIIWLVRHRLPWLRPARSWSVEARRALGALEEARGKEYRAVAENVAKTLIDYVQRRFHIQLAEPTPLELPARLAEKRIKAEAAVQLQQALEICAAARFAPERTRAYGEILAKAQQTIAALEGYS